MGKERKVLAIIEGARAPIFERLIDEPAPGTGGKKILNKQELKQSLRRELERLLNSRCSYPARFLDDEEDLTVIDYGIPDLSNYSAQDSDHQRLIAAVIGKAIAAFEPRLQDVDIQVESFTEHNWALSINIEGTLVVDSLVEPVSFPLIFKNKSGVALLNGEE